jgi:superfamily II DNA or RNA helicase
VAAEGAAEPARVGPSPRPIQMEALEALEATRENGHRAGLAVLATGLGKTWLAAFDSDRAGFPRVLFIAHREEILTQARDVFRQVRPDARLGFFTSQEKAADTDVLFATVQTLHRHLGGFPAAAFE